MPAASATGSVERGQHGPAPERGDDHGRDQHRCARASMPAPAPRSATRRAEDDVDREQHGVGGGEDHAERLAGEHDVREQIDACRRPSRARQVARGAGAERRQHDHGQELDRGDGAQRQAVDRAVEQAVHQGEHRAPGDQHAPAVAVERREAAPRPPPDGEDERRRGDPQPGDAEHVDAGEEQHRERGTEVVEHRADGEEALRRRLLREQRGPTAHGRSSRARDRRSCRIAGHPLATVVRARRHAISM